MHLHFSAAEKPGTIVGLSLQLYLQKLTKDFLDAVHGCSGNAASCVCRRIFLKVCGTSVQLLFIHGVNPLKCVKILPTHYKNPATHGLGL